MKRKFSLLVTIVFCLLLVAGILSACNDPVEGLESVAGSYFMKDDSAGWWELGLDGQWLNSLGERGTYEFTPGEGDEVNGELAFYDATGAVIYTGNVQGAGLGIKGDTEVLWNLEKNPNTVNFQAVYAYAEDLGYTGSLEDLVKLFKGDSAYGLAKKYGYTGTEKDWLDSLRGEKGDSGKSAYDLVVELGYKGTLSDWLASLTGDKGDSAYDIACGFGFIGTIQDWLNSLGGNGIEKIEKTSSEGNVDTYTIYYTKGGTTTFTVTNGKSAYELAVENGYQGTVEEWLASLVGETGANGEDGKSAYELAVENGYEGTLDDWLESLVGATGATGEAGSDGKSAYELAVENGFEGSLEEWLTSLVGSAGADGADGSDGADGVGIEKIEKTGSDGNVDTYTIYFTNGETTTFTVTNAVNSVPVTVTFEARGGVIEGYDYLDLTFVGGEYDAYTATILSGNAIEQLPIPVRSGLQFCGWFTGTTINDGQWLNNNTVSVDFTLYARWTSHPFVHYDRVEPDCTNDGNIEYWYCPDCDQYFSDPGCTIVIDEGDIILPAAGHMMTEYPYKAATCTEDGNVAYWYCNVCEKYFSDAEGANSIRENQIGIPAAGHSYTETVVNPTCITGGYTLHECSICGDSYRDNELPKLGHNFVDGVCSVCGEQFYSDGLEFTLSGDESYYTVTDVGTATGDIIIPDIFNDLPVREIGEYAFYGCTDTTSISIPAGVTSIGYSAFSGCSSLASVSFAEGSQLTSIGQNAFSGCSSLTSIEIPAGVNSIAYGAFEECSNLTSIEIPSEVTSIGISAFSGCSNLSTAYYAGSIENWFNIEFEYDNSNPLYYGAGLYIGGEPLTEVVVPESITTIDTQLRGCTSLTSITIHSGVTSIGDYAFSRCSNLASVTFAEGSQLTSIGSSAFRDCSSLTSIEIPAGVTSIGSYAFSGCSSLTSIEIPAGVTSIGDYAFSRCSNLASVTFAEGRQLTSIGDYAFYECGNLTSIEIPAGVTSIGDGAFRNCSNLESVTFAEGSGLTSIGSSAFRDCGSLTSIEIPAGVTSIGGSAFNGCISLTSIEIPAGVTSIGEYAFYNCSSLRSVTFAEGSELTSIGSGAFEDCGSLTSIEIPAGVTSIGYQAFLGCSNLESVTFAEGSQLTSIGGSAFVYCSSLASVTFAEGSQLTGIGSYAFEYCSSLTSIEIPAGVKSIGDTAFYHCYNLNTVYYAGSIEDWLNIEFESSTSNPLYYVADLYIGGELVTEVVVPESVTTIGYQLTGCANLTSITIHSGVTSIGSDAFRYCSNLESVTFAEGSQLTSIGDEAFIGCSSLASVTFAEGSELASIGDFAFNGCSSLQSIDIPAGLTSIGNGAFRDCSSLISIEIPVGVTNIGSDAFERCYLTIVYNYSDLEITAGNSDYGYVAYYAEVVLTEDNLANVKDENGYVTYTDGEEVLLLGYLGREKDIVIPDGVTRIVDYAFCEDDIVSVTLPESLTAIGDWAFSGCYNLKEVYNNSSLNITAGNNSYGYVAYYAVKVHNSSESESIFDDESGFAIVDGVLYGYRGSATNIIIPETVTSIAEYAFYGNTDIISVSIPSGVISIGESAFSGCSNLTSIEIPAGVTSIGYLAFQSCNNLESVTFAEAEGSQLTDIGSSAFSGCSSLTSIEVPAGVTSIGDYAFYACSNLESVSFAEVSQLTSIGRSAFEDCRSLQSIEIPAGVTSIGSSAFRDCSSLTSIEIPAGVTGIGYDAFLDCSNLNTVYYAGSIENWFDIEFEYGESNPLYNGADLYIGGELLTEVVVSESITTIGTQLRGYTSLTSITIHSGVTSIGDYAFSRCSNLASVTFAEGSQLTSIGSYAFRDCSSLTSIEIPAGVTSIGWYAFQNCSNLTSIEIPAGVISIGDQAFYGCSNLTSIEIPAGVTSIGSSAFRFCRNLNTVYYAGSIENWFDIAFEESDSNPLSNGAGLYIGGEPVTEVVVPESIATIGDYQFYRCTSLTSITIHSGVTSIGERAFQSCNNLESVTFAEGSQLTSIGDYAFYYCSSLETVTLVEGSEPTSIGNSGIGYSAFSGCSNLTSIEIPAGVTSIGNLAFQSCNNLESVTFAEGSQLTDIPKEVN